ncbi:unnamed protein product, partial [Cyprideis torosa]
MGLLELINKNESKQLGDKKAKKGLGMGGGTGTGAAPVIAQAARDLDLLTVGIVTIPFRFEGKLRVKQALEGVKELEKQVDALLVINNEKLRLMF